MPIQGFATGMDDARRIETRTIALLAVVVVSGCMMVGPDYQHPQALLASDWIPRDGGSIGPSSEPIGPWWESFGDPILTNLIVEAYRQNPSLQAAGVRVLEAHARRGIAIGTLFPQVQNAVAAYSRNVASENVVTVPPERSFNDFLVGLDVGWELDFWGKFRRGIESADAQLLAAVADYDDVLVSLLAEVAANYIGIRTAQEELDVARRNAELHPPRRVEELVGDAPAQIPSPPAKVAVGVPADLLRRRPDVRRSERILAAQSAQIGIAKADLFPHLSLVGSINLEAKDADKFFEGRSFEAFGGPTFSWAILNYGRITNNVRVQDAEYQALVNEYTNSVLRAQADVESAIAAHRGALLRTASLRESVVAAEKVVDLVGRQYAEGAVDFTTVLLSQQFLVQQQDLLAASRGQEGLTMVTLYKSLGGGWETWAGASAVSSETAAQMKSRTRWGDLLEERKQRNIAEAASTGTEHDRGWWRWRWWRPQW